MDKKVTTLAELVNIFSGFTTEELMDKILRFYEDIQLNASNEFPFPHTDVDWINSLMESFLQADDLGAEINLFKVFQYGINDYVMACIKENPAAAYLVEDYRDKDAFVEPVADIFFDIDAERQFELEDACMEYELDKMQDMDVEELVNFLQQYDLSCKVPNHIL